MRVVYVDPYLRSVEEQDVDPNPIAFDDLVDGEARPHYIVMQALPDHDGCVDQNAIVKRKKAWNFANCVVWGPLIIVGGEYDDEMSDATVSVDTVRALCRFDG